MSNKMQWFLTGAVSVCVAYLLAVCIGTALLLRLDEDNGIMLKVPASQSVRTEESARSSVYDVD